MLFGVVLGLSSFFQTREKGQAVIDDFPFRLFYSFTCGILFLSTALLGVQDLVGKNIDCYNREEGDTPAAVNQYCWVTGTHLLVNGRRQGFSNTSLASSSFTEAACQFNETTNSWRINGRDGTFCSKAHGYYQWVPYVLVIQGLLFYAPRLFWVTMEEGKMSSFSDGVRAGSETGADWEEKLQNVAKKIAAYVNMRHAGHLSYGRCYIIAQALNLIVLLFVFWFNNHFLDGQFSYLGTRWLSGLDSDTSASALESVFPRMTRCEFQRYTKGGKISRIGYLCVLAPNIISEKIFLFLWFWYLTLLVVSAVNLGLVLAMAFKNVHVRALFMSRAVLSNKVRKHLTSSEGLRNSLNSMEFGKFLFIYLLGRNVEYFTYKQIVDLALEGEGSTATRGPSPKTKFSQQMSSSDVKDAGSEELEVELPKYMANAPPASGDEHSALDDCVGDEGSQESRSFNNQDTIHMKSMLKKP